MTILNVRTNSQVVDIGIMEDLADLMTSGEDDETEENAAGWLRPRVPGHSCAAVLWRNTPYGAVLEFFPTETAARAAWDDAGAVLHREGSILHDYRTGEAIRPATREEFDASLAAAERDSGRGVIEVDGRLCYVPGEVFIGDNDG